MVDLDAGFFLVKFDQLADRTRVLNDGPWMVFDSYLTIMTWRPNFKPDEMTPKQTMVWARFPGLCIEYFDEYILTQLAAA